MQAKNPSHEHTSEGFGERVEAALVGSVKAEPGLMGPGESLGSLSPHTLSESSHGLCWNVIHLDHS